MSKLIGMNGGGKQPPTNVQPQIDITSLPRVECGECGGVLYRQVIGLKRISKFDPNYGNGIKDILVPIPIFRCDDCGAILEEFIAEQF